MSDKGRTAYYFAHRGAEAQPAIIRADYGPDVKVQLGDGTHRTVPWRWVMPTVAVAGDFAVWPTGSGLGLFDLSQLEADIAAGKASLHVGDTHSEPEHDHENFASDPGDEDPPPPPDDPGPGHTPGTDPQPGHGNDGNTPAHGGTPPGHGGTPPGHAGGSPGKSGEAPGHGGAGHHGKK